MYSRLSEIAFRWARITPQPEPPFGAPGSVRTFRAGKNYYYIRLLRWGSGQIGAAIGLTFSIGFTTAAVQGFERAVASPPAAVGSPSPESPISTSPSPHASMTPAVVGPAAAATPSGEAKGPTLSGAPSPSPTASRSSRRNRDRVSAGAFLRRMTSRMPPWVLAVFTSWFVPVLLLLELLGILVFLAQLPFTYALARLEFEQHWYIVTDRSLRIRTGVLSLTESTMSFANIQQVEVKQGPLQRFLGLADVRVRSAGGGAVASDSEDGGEMHTGTFHSVENAEEIRDLILARLRTFREAGLGDPDRAPRPRPKADFGVSAETLEAAWEVLRQTRALRAATAPNA